MSDFLYVLKTLPKLLPFVRISLGVLFFSILSGTILAFGLTLIKLGKNKFARKLAYGYTTAIRCTPAIVMLFLVFYGLPILCKVFGYNIDRWGKHFFIVITLMLLCSASLSEAMRTAYLSVDPGQYAAALSVGLSRLDAMFSIVFPQAFKVFLPVFGNNVIAILKDGSLGFTIGFVDIIGQAALLNNISRGTRKVEIYFAAALIYWVLAVIIEFVLVKGEQTQSYD